MNTSFTGLVVILVLFAIPAAIWAQESADDDSARRRLDNLRKIKLVEALDLTEEQSVRLFAREREFREKEKQHRDKRQALLESLQSKLNANASDEELRIELRRISEAVNEMHNARHNYMLSLSDILSTKQIANMVLFENRFSKEIRKLLMRSRKDDAKRR